MNAPLQLRFRHLPLLECLRPSIRSVECRNIPLYLLRRLFKIMAETKIGTAIYRQNLSPVLAIFRLVPENGHRFPEYRAGQYVALRRENCRLTKRSVREDGRVEYDPVLDENGNQQFGPVTHSYSVASAPHETRQNGFLEFYILLEMHETGHPGRLTESLFQVDPAGQNAITYYTKIAGDFTLEKRAAGYRNVVMIGTGTGLAPFASMVKELHYRATTGEKNDTRYTLIHVNRGRQELGYHQRLLEIEASRAFDFVYVPAVSRPSKEDLQDPRIGKGRANNLLRAVFDLPLREGELLHQSTSRSNGIDHARKILDRTVRPILPNHVSKNDLLDRMTSGETVVLACGNPILTADIRQVVMSRGIMFEQEEW